MTDTTETNTDTQRLRMSRDKASRMHFAAQFLDSEHATVDVRHLVEDYIAVLDKLEALELTMQKLKDWLRDEARTSHLQAEEVYDGRSNVHYERYMAFEEIIAIIDEGKLP